MTEGPYSEILDPEEAAQFLRLSPRTLEYYRQQARGPAYSKLGKNVVYAREDLRAWIRIHRVETE
jgi:hypothetical protein